MNGKEIAELSEKLGKQIVAMLREDTERALWEHEMPAWRECAECAADEIHDAFKGLAEEEKPATPGNRQGVNQRGGQRR